MRIVRNTNERQGNIQLCAARTLSVWVPGCWLWHLSAAVPLDQLTEHLWRPRACHELRQPQRRFLIYPLIQGCSGQTKAFSYWQKAENFKQRCSSWWGRGDVPACEWGCAHTQSWVHLLPRGSGKVTALTRWEGPSCFCLIRWKLGLGCDMSWNSRLSFFILHNSRLLERYCLSDYGKSRTLSQIYQPHCHSKRGFCFGRSVRIWGGKGTHGLPILYGIKIFLVLHYSNKDALKSDHLTHLLYFQIRKPAWSWALNLLLIHFPWLMSTEMVTAAEKSADLSEPGFIPLVQLLNVWDEARGKKKHLFLSS